MNADKSLPMDSENSSRRSTHKTLNVRLLAISVVVVVVVGVAVYFWHAAQVSRLKGALLLRRPIGGEAAVE